MLFRSLTLGLLGACLFFLVTTSRRAAAPPVTSPPDHVANARSLPPTISVVDVAHGVGTGMVLDLIRLAPGERVTAVGDGETASDLAAGAAIRDQLGNYVTNRFIDLTVGGPSGERRVLVLLH